MSYDAIEERLQLLLQGLTTQFPAPVSPNTTAVTRGDWRVIDSGADKMAILHPGVETEGDSMSAGSVERTWSAHLDLIKRYLDDGTTAVNFEKMRDAVLQHLQKYPSLNGLAGVQAVGQINAEGDPFYIYDKDGAGPFFYAQTFSIPVTAIETVTIAE